MSAKIFNLTSEKIFASDSEHSGLATSERVVSDGPGFTGAISLPLLPDLIQLYTTAMTTGALTIRRGNDSGTIWIDHGSMVHAICGELSGEDAVYRLLQWQDGQFSLEADAPAPTRTITTSWQAVLIEGCRRLDEGNIAPFTLLETAALGDSADDRFQRTLEAIERAVPSVQASAIFDADGETLAHWSGAARVDVSELGPAVLQMLAEQSRIMKAVGNQSPLQDLLSTLGDQLHFLRVLEEGRLLYVVSARSDTNLALLRRAVERAVGLAS